MLLSDYRAKPPTRNDMPCTLEGFVKKGGPSVERAELLWYGVAARILRQLRKLRPLAGGQHDGPGFLERSHGRTSPARFHERPRDERVIQCKGWTRSVARAVRGCQVSK